MLALLFSLVAVAQQPPPPPVAATEPWLRVGAAFAMVPHSYKLEASATDVPDGLTYSSGMFTGGFELQGVAFLPNAPTWGAELSWRGFSDLIDVDGESYNRFGNSFYVGGRYRLESASPLRWYGALGFHRIAVPLFRYPSATQTSGRAELLQMGILGLRLGVGGLYTMDKLHLDFGLGQTLSPQPIDFNIGGSAEYSVGHAIALRGALDVDSRTVGFDVADADATVHDTEVAITLGVNYLRF